ncbi:MULTISPECIES: DUF4232 domain-containing protein [unclassified Streptomyces]|uniref:DUF4232 domain-containing protein n=1 Tax=unclassified Streptomyces TaxID=2593676 RepID=UPI0003A662F8|nr:MULTISPECIES: DUF4232 domain-containing protein [unclassified Streptomyces]MYT29560.1 DUF4232 domain-containing protein [Streptomyces sp. SID8354]
MRTTRKIAAAAAAAMVLGATAAGVAQASPTAAAKATAVGKDASSATSGHRCHTGELRYSWDSAHGGRPDMDATSQQIAAVRLKNNGGRTCTLHGFPGVRLISASGEAWDLRRSADRPSTITLRPGDDMALVTVAILPVARHSAGAFLPSKVLITPPDERTHVTLAWPYGGAILDQSGATHPGTYVNPVGVG